MSDAVQLVSLPVDGPGAGDVVGELAADCLQGAPDRLVEFGAVEEGLIDLRAQRFELDVELVARGLAEACLQLDRRNLREPFREVDLIPIPAPLAVADHAEGPQHAALARERKPEAGADAESPQRPAHPRLAMQL